MKKTYKVVAKLDQIVTKEVHLTVLAGSEEEAEKKSRDALEVYPSQVPDQDVKRILTTKTHFWIPKSIDFKQTKEEDNNTNA